MQTTYALIIECARIKPDYYQVHELASQIRDWKQLLKSSYAHGVFPLVAKTLKQLPNIPDETQKMLKLTTIDIAQHNLQATGELMRVIGILKDHGIDPITFKGPVLSQMAYGDIVSRQYGDLDILVDEHKIVDAVDILNQYGYENALSIDVLKNRTCLNIIKDFTIVNTKNGVTFELHWKLFEKKYALSMFNYPEKNTQYIEINHKPILMINDEIFLVYLCIHGSKHMWERLEWICDIDRLIRNRQYDWEQVIRLALSLEHINGVFLGFALAESILQTPLPKQINQYIHTNRIKELVEDVTNSLQMVEGSESEFVHNKAVFFFQIKVLDTITQKIRFFVGVMFNISEEDCQTFHLPDPLKYVYLVLRPYRLMKKGVRKIFR